MEERSADPILQHGKSPASGKRQMIKVTVQPGGHQIKLRIWSSTLEVKQQLGEASSVPVSWMRLLHNNVELLNSQLLIDLVPNVRQPRRGASDGSRGHGSSPSRSLTFWLKVQNPHDFDSGCYLHPWGIGTNAAGAAGERLLTRAAQGLQMGLAPQLSVEGSGGTYLLRDTQKRPIAAFKPRDEEPFAPNNPRGLAGKMGQPGIHPHVASGDAHIREVLAFRLDWGGFASVPCTLQVEGRHPALHVNSVQPLSRYGAKVGSLQAWVKHDDTASDRGTATFPVHEVHKIAILDMRLLNTDRHDSNLLVVDREARDGATTCELVPIDHGGCLPSLPEVSWFNWCWLSWPQMKVPLSDSDAAYVANLDVKAEEKLLIELGVPARPRRALYCSTMLLQRGVASGLSLLEVASLMCRDEDEDPSELERLWTQAERLAYSALHNHRLRGCSDAYSSTPASRKGGAVRASSPTAAPGAAEEDDLSTRRSEEGDLPSRRSEEADDLSARRSQEEDLSARSTAEDEEASPPKQSAQRGGHRRTASNGVAKPPSPSPSLRPAKGLPIGSPKPRHKMERWSEGSIEPSPPQTPSGTPTATPTFARPALTGLKRVISSSTLMDVASYSTFSADADATHGPAEDSGSAYSSFTHTRRLGMSAVSEEPGGAAEASFLAYFERMLDDMVERHVARRDREQPAAPPECKSPRTSHGLPPLDDEVIFETEAEAEAEVP